MTVTDQPIDPESRSRSGSGAMYLQQILAKFPKGLPDKVSKLLDDVKAGVLTEEEAWQLASVYEEELETEEVASSVLASQGIIDPPAPEAEVKTPPAEPEKPAAPAEPEKKAETPLVAGHVLALGYASIPTAPASTLTSTAEPTKVDTPAASKPTEATAAAPEKTPAAPEPTEAISAAPEKTPAPEPAKSEAPVCSLVAQHVLGGCTVYGGYAKITPHEQYVAGHVLARGYVSVC